MMLPVFRELNGLRGDYQMDDTWRPGIRNRGQ